MKICASIMGAIFAFMSLLAQAESFEKNRVQVYGGPSAKPDFNSRPGASKYRTQILDEMKRGANFSGHYSIVKVGCGTGCTFSYLVDVKSGRISGLPFGGEVYNMLSFSHRVDSNLIKVSWVEFLDGDDEKPICVRQELVFENSEFNLLEKSTRTAPTGYCES